MWHLPAGSDLGFRDKGRTFTFSLHISVFLSDLFTISFLLV